MDTDSTLPKLSRIAIPPKKVVRRCFHSAVQRSLASATQKVELNARVCTEVVHVATVQLYEVLTGTIVAQSAFAANAVVANAIRGPCYHVAANAEFVAHVSSIHVGYHVHTAGKQFWTL